MTVETTPTARVVRTFAAIAILGVIALAGTSIEPLQKDAAVHGMPAPSADAVAEPHPQSF